MKVSVNWIKEYLDFELPPTDELVACIGAQIGAVEAVIDLGAQYKDVLIARVVSCEKLADSDHLNVCWIDDGGKASNVERNDQGLVQVVCGAPNVRAGILVAWLPPGTTVPSSFGKDPFVLEARSLRGTLSNGMLASPKELAIGDGHEGIMEIDAGEPGADFAKTYKLDDVIIDVENKMFTHRPDCFGELGVAREVAAVLGQQFTSPDWYKNPSKELPLSADRLPLVIKNELPELVPRFMAVAISGLKVQPSPIWLQTLLSRVGIRPINNIVDVTNYMMMLTGQPLHAYDYDKVRALDGTDTATLIARNPRDSERLTLLNGKTIDPRKEAIMIATETTPVGLGGVMGGAETEVTDATVAIILECATFDMYSIRRTSMAHGLFSDAVTRFNKGQSPLQNEAVLLKAAQELLAGGTAQLASDVLDSTSLPSETLQRGSLHPPMSIETAFINARLGFLLSGSEMATVLANAEFTVESHDDWLQVSAPFWRTDIELREDIVEEVGRLHGFDKLPLQLPLRSVAPATTNYLFNFKTAIRNQLSRGGANEVLTYSFVHGKLLDNVGQNKDLAFKLNNALSPELQYYRLSLVPSLLNKVHANVKSGYDEFALFELGKVHSLDYIDSDADGLPQEFEKLAFVYAANDKLKKSGAAYHMAKYYLESLASHFGLALRFEPITTMPDSSFVKPFDPERCAAVSDVASGEPLGIVGEFSAAVRKNLKLPVFSAGFELDIEALFGIAGSKGYRTLSKFPATEQDICFRIPNILSYGELQQAVFSDLSVIKPPNSLLQISPLDIYQRQDDTDHKQITFRLRLTSYERTLTDKEVSNLVEQLAASLAQKFDVAQV
ncbi:MAG: hypothetical protein JWM81_1024 [Candidatus Saccharibacteria bacterium]|nr:hypothetical protein [Candidatus Saccharibacteria bacterium]